MKTKAIVFARKETVLIQELDVMPPGENEIQVQSTFSTISAGTESWRLRDLFTWFPTQFPSVPGYQRVGIVTAVGARAKDWRVGDRVATITGVFANADIARQFGAHIAVANTPTDAAYHLSEEIDDIDASNLVVAQVGYNAATRATFYPGDWVVVFGDGLVGQCAAQAARARGGRVVVIGHHVERLALAKRFSADATINSNDEHVVTAVRKLVGAKTVPVVLDSVQTPGAQTQYVDLLGPGQGQIVYNGFTPGETWADMSLLQKRELTTHFVSGVSRERLEKTLVLMKEGKMRSKPLVTHLVPYTRGPDMYRMVLNKGQPFLGITLDWRNCD